MNTSHAKGWLADFLVLAAIWGSSFLFMRLAAVELGALPTAAIRVAIASTFLLPLMLAKGHWAALRQHWKPVLFVGVLNSGIPFALYSFAVMHISTGFQCCRRAAQWPLASIRGNKKVEAIATRMAAVGKAPSSTAARRMNKKDEPQMAASTRKSASQPLA